MQSFKDEQLDILEIPQKKKEMVMPGTELSEFLDEFSHDYADQWPAGEEYIQNYIDEFLKFKGTTYKVKRNFPAIDATAKLSPYINAGVVSSKWCLVKLKNITTIYWMMGTKELYIGFLKYYGENSIDI